MMKSDKFYFNNFRECATLIKSAALYLVSCLENFEVEKIEEMLDTMHIIEHNADLKKHEMNEMLAKAFVTPVDREDLDMLSHQLDNVLDKIEEVLQKFYIYNIKEVNKDAILYAHLLVKNCEVLVQLMNELENYKKSKSIHALIITCNDIEEECDLLYLSATHALTKSHDDLLSIIGWYKIFDCFEAAVNACEHVSDCIRTIIMKNT